MYPFDTERVVIEIVSAIICFALAKFMINPYKLTREGRYLGLPLGFAFLGISYAISALVYSPLTISAQFLWLPLLARTFAFVFLATTYIFSNVNSKKGQLLGEIFASLLVIALTSLLLLEFVAPKFAFEGYMKANVYIRIFNVVCLSYVAIHTLRSHIRNPDPKTICIPFGFIFFAISQYSLISWYVDSSFSAFVGSFIARFIGLGIFLFVALRTFYVQDKEGW